jgi:predicted nucleic acid-binding protein
LDVLREALLISQRKPARSFAGYSFGDGLPGERDPLVTVWPALTEAMYLLNFSWRAQDALWELVLERTVRLLPVEADDHRRMRDLMKKYRMLPMDLADAALVAVAERERIRRIFTMDRRDFSLYRPAKLGKFMIVP